MSSSRRVLITGGAGFVGATLVRRLAAAGYAVRVLDNYSTGDPSYLDGVAAGAPEHPVEYRPARAGEVGRNFASYDLARQVLGYAPSISREDGIRQTWQWFQESVFVS
jgi:nucleoside-diphosphate-sugar epimerase